MRILPQSGSPEKEKPPANFTDGLGQVVLICWRLASWREDRNCVAGPRRVDQRMQVVPLIKSPCTGNRVRVEIY